MTKLTFGIRLVVNQFLVALKKFAIRKFQRLNFKPMSCLLDFNNIPRADNFKGIAVDNDFIVAFGEYAIFNGRCAVQDFFAVKGNTPRDRSGWQEQEHKYKEAVSHA